MLMLVLDQTPNEEESGIQLIEVRHSSSGKIIQALVILKFNQGYPGLMRLARLVRLVRLSEAQQIPYSVMSQFQSLPETSLGLV